MNNLLALFLQAPPHEPFLFASEKVNTVLVVVLIVFAGMIGILVMNFLKVGRLEKEIKELRDAASRQDAQKIKS